MAPSSRVCSESWVTPLLGAMSLPPPSPSSLHYRPWWCLFVAHLSLMFIVPAICHLLALVFTGVGVHWCCRSLLLALAFVVVIVGIGIHKHWCWLVLVLAFIVGWHGCWCWHSLLLVILASIVISSSPPMSSGSQAGWWRWVTWHWAAALSVAVVVVAVQKQDLLPPCEQRLAAAV